MKRKHEFYSEMLQQMNAEEQARATRVEQEAIHEAKIRQQENHEEAHAANTKLTQVIQLVASDQPAEPIADEPAILLINTGKTRV